MRKSIRPRIKRLLPHQTIAKTIDDLRLKGDKFAAINQNQTYGITHRQKRTDYRRR